MENQVHERKLIWRQKKNGNGRSDLQRTSNLFLRELAAEDSVCLKRVLHRHVSD